MAQITETLNVPAPAAEVFAFVADFSHLCEWDPSVDAARQVDAGPIGVGTRFEVELKIGPLPQKLTYTVEVWQPSERAVLATTNLLFTGRDTVTFREVASGTEVTYHATFALRIPGVTRLLDPRLQPGFDDLGRKAIAGLARAFADRTTHTTPTPP